MTVLKNPRVVAWFKATGATKFNGHAFGVWLQEHLALAADQGRGAFRFNGGDGRPHINNHPEFTKFLQEVADAQSN